MQKRENPFAKFIRDVPVSSITPKDRNLITINDTDSVTEALTKLSAAKILSAPVFDRENNCAGFISAESVTSYLWGSQKGKLNWGKVDLSAIPVRQVLDERWNRDVLVPFFEANPVALLAALMKTGVHRVALFTENRELVRTCSETDVVLYMKKLLESQPALKNIANATVKDLGLIDSNVVVVSDQLPVGEVLSILAEKKLSAVAVRTDRGKLQGNFSASDLRGLVESNFGDLSLSVAGFLEKHSPAALHPLTVLPQCTLLQLLDLIIAKKLHRVWVVDERDVSSSVISLSAIVGLLTEESANPRQVAGDIGKLWRATPINQDGFNF